MEIKNGKARVFIHARQFTDDRWQIYLPPYRVESRVGAATEDSQQAQSASRLRSAGVVQCEPSAAGLRNDLCKPCYLFLKETSALGKGEANEAFWKESVRRERTEAPFIWWVSRRSFCKFCCLDSSRSTAFVVCAARKAYVDEDRRAAHRYPLEPGIFVNSGPRSEKTTFRS